MKKIDQSIFRAYDIRGKYPTEIDAQTAYKIGRGYVKKTGAKRIVVGRDMRQASAEMMGEMVRGLADEGAAIAVVGQITTDMISFAVNNYGFDGGVILSASHNPVGYGGVKMMIKDAVSIPGDDPELMGYINAVDYQQGDLPKTESLEIFNDYIKYVLSFIDTAKLVQKKVVLDPLFGSCGLILKQALSGLPIEPIYLHETADPNFGGLSAPNPIDPEINQFATKLAKESQADFGAIWDGDADRCFFIDNEGQPVPVPYITALITEYLLKKNPGATIVCDPRIIWPIEKAVQTYGGKLEISKSGYRYIKEKMSQSGAVFAGEASAHYFFRDNHNADNGFIPFLIIWEMISESGKTLSELIAPYRQNHFTVDETTAVVSGRDEVEKILSEFHNQYHDCEIDTLDGVTIASEEFRINVRASNTEPKIRANIETRSSQVLERELVTINKLFGTK